MKTIRNQNIRKWGVGKLKLKFNKHIESSIIEEKIKIHSGNGIEGEWQNIKENMLHAANVFWEENK